MRRISHALAACHAPLVWKLLAIATILPAAIAAADPAPAAPADGRSPLAVGASAGVASIELRSTDGSLQGTGPYAAAELEVHLSPRWSVAATAQYTHLSGSEYSNGYHIAIDGGASDLFVGTDARLWLAQRVYLDLGLGIVRIASDDTMPGAAGTQSSLDLRAAVGVDVVRFGRLALRADAGVNLYVFDSFSQTRWLALGVVFR